MPPFLTFMVGDGGFVFSYIQSNVLTEEGDFVQSYHPS